VVHDSLKPQAAYDRFLRRRDARPAEATVAGTGHA
jgi:hypothetical protein